jgi:methanogenic corrinoid protein MtbC1
MRRPPLGGRLAIVACPPGERHGVPARMLGDFLEGAGWEVLVVGPDVPVRDLLAMVEDEQPDVVCLSVTMPSSIDATFELLGALGTCEPRPLLAIGGQAWDGSAKVADALGADVIAADPVELLQVLGERLPPLPEEDPAQA